MTETTTRTRKIIEAEAAELTTKLAALREEWKTAAVEAEVIDIYKAKEGDRVSFEKLVKYVPYDFSRSADKQLEKSVYRTVTGVVTGFTMWMDNSTDVHVLTDDGKKVIHQVMYPHGDACF